MRETAKTGIHTGAQREKYKTNPISSRPIAINELRLVLRAEGKIGERRHFRFTRGVTAGAFCLCGAHSQCAASRLFSTLGAVRLRDWRFSTLQLAAGVAQLGASRPGVPNVNAARPLTIESGRGKHSCLSHPPPGGSPNVGAAFTLLCGADPRLTASLLVTRRARVRSFRRSAAPRSRAGPGVGQKSAVPTANPPPTTPQNPVTPV